MVCFVNWNFYEPMTYPYIPNLVGSNTHTTSSSYESILAFKFSKIKSNDLHK